MSGVCLQSESQQNGLLALFLRILDAVKFIYLILSIITFCTIGSNTNTSAAKITQLGILEMT